MGSNGVWCGIYAKYLAFGTYLTSAVGGQTEDNTMRKFYVSVIFVSENSALYSKDNSKRTLQFC